MARDRLTFRERDLASAVKVAQAQGLKIARIEVKQDGLSLILRNGEPIPGPDEDLTAKRKEAVDHAVEKAAGIGRPKRPPAS